MKVFVLGLALILIAATPDAMARAYSGSLSTRTLGSADLEKITVGVDVERVGRTIEVNPGIKESLDVIAYSVFLGYDLLPALTAFATVGATEDRTSDGYGADENSPLTWSVGANINLLDYGLRQPSLLNEHRVTMRLTGEIASYKADWSDWKTYSLALPLTYEIIERGKFTTPNPNDRFVLSLYAGPLLSVIDGRLNTDIGDVDFEQDQSFGLLAGADLLLTRSVSLGGHVELFDKDDDKITGGASFRYHF